MIDALVAKVWSNPRFHALTAQLELAWLAKELDLPGKEMLAGSVVMKVAQAAAILACSENTVHRVAAYKAATYAFELQGGESVYDGLLRVVFSRLGNFAAIQTRASISNAMAQLPLRLAVEEIASADLRTVNISGKAIQLTDFQIEIWRGLSAKRRIALSAPTSAGKSFVLQAFLSKLFEDEKSIQVIYLVPTRALIAQVSSDLAASFDRAKSKPDIVTIPTTVGTKLSNRAVLVLTQERLQLVLQAHLTFAADLIIVDEAHSIADGARGVLLQWVIDELINRNPSTQTLFASPVVRNLSVFGKIFGLPDVNICRSVEPTVSQNFILIDIESASRGSITLKRVDPEDGDTRVLGSKTLDTTLASRQDRLVHIPLSMRGTGSCIVYANGAAEAEEVALKLAAGLSDRAVTKSQSALAKLAREVVHEKYVLPICIEKGVGFHYSNIPTILRLAIEDAFKIGDLDYLVCTSTLLQGVNLPARHLFMLAPEKGRGNPLKAEDFWNLSGRAGRLGKEFQGNIFLIDYAKWRSQPLQDAKDTEIRSAIEVMLTDSSDELIATIRNEQDRSTKIKISELESSFVRLFSDYQDGSLYETLTRAGIEPKSPLLQRVEAALGEASRGITIPSKVLKRCGSISGYRQQRLFAELDRLLTSGREMALSLIPAHPREDRAYVSYAKILELCYSVLFGRDPSRGLHRLHALIALRWMTGWPLPQIIQAQINRYPNRNVRVLIRDTLELIEKDIRFHVARVFFCYNSLLVYALEQHGFAELASGVPGIPLFLEVGASDQTMISLMEIGISRVTATKLNEAANNKSMTTREAREWLVSRPLETLGLSPILEEEISTLLAEFRVE